jgi:predicted enzyme related to lactoylglutathione lyase
MKSAAVLYVKQLGPMQAFYRECFAMEVVDAAEEYCVLESEALVLSLVAVPDRIAATLHVSVPPRRREETPIKLSFSVDSIEGARLVVAEMGGLVDPRPSEWEFRGSMHCDGVDPEGNVLQLVEPVRTPPAAAGTP